MGTSVFLESLDKHSAFGHTVPRQFTGEFQIRQLNQK
jgi:hypothetical protein